MSSFPDHGCLRWLRGSVVGLVAIGVALTLHISAHGSVQFGPVLFALPVAMLVGVALANRRYTWWRACAVLLALQPVIHLLADTTTHHPVDTTRNSPAQGTQMLLAHVAAATIAATWLATGDRIVWGLIRQAFDRLIPVWSLERVPPKLPRSLTAQLRLDLRTRDLVRIAPRRGPPAFVGC